MSSLEAHLGVGALTRRQQEIVGGVLDGKSPQEVGAALRVSKHTVYDHLQHVYRAWNVVGLQDLLHRARLHWDCCELERLVRVWHRE